MKRQLTFIAMLAFLILAGCEKKTTTESETLGKNAQNTELSNSDEININAADLPAAILAYLEQNYQGYLFEEAEIEGSGAAATYTVEIRINDQDIELVFDSIGSFVGLEDDDEDNDEDNDEGEQNEREIDISELPEGVVNSIANLYPGSTILEADEITAADGSFRYEIEIQVGSEIIDLMFAADGTYMGVEDDGGYYDDEDDNGDDDEDEEEDEDGDNDGDHENEDGE